MRTEYLFRAEVLAMKRILITGFEPFLNYKVNPSLEVMKALNGKWFGNFEVVGRELSVDFEKAAEQLTVYLDEVKPDMLISLGIAAGRHRITPEQIAINLREGEKDNCGFQPENERIDPTGEDGIFTNLPIRQMVATLKDHGYPAEVSYSAGTYLCNQIMYKGLQYSKKQPEVYAGFIHLPASFELALEHRTIPGWPVEQLIAAVELCIKEAVDFAEK